MLIALEGADGCGKTTLSEILAQRLGATRYSSPPKKYLKARKKIDESASNEERYQFYRDGIYDAHHEIMDLIENGEKVITDRYWLTTYTYHKIMGASASKEDFDSVIKPDLTVILALSYDTQVKRMMHRGMSEADHRDFEKQQEVARAFYNNALEFNIPFIVIDTQFFSASQCADITIAALNIGAIT